MKYILFSLALLIFVPSVALAQAFGDIGQFFQDIATLINNTLVPLVFGLAFLLFLWGILQTFILGAEDEEKRTKGRSYMLWAIIGFVVMASLWGIVNLIAGGLGIDTNEDLQNIPNAPIRQD